MLGYGSEGEGELRDLGAYEERRLLGEEWAGGAASELMCKTMYAIERGDFTAFGCRERGVLRALGLREGFNVTFIGMHLLLLCPSC